MKWPSGHARATFNALRHFKPGQAGHLDVEESEVGFQRSDALGGFNAVARYRQQLQIRPQCGQFRRQGAREVRFVVGDQCCGYGALFCKGRVMRASVPGCAALTSSVASLP